MFKINALRLFSIAAVFAFIPFANADSDVKPSYTKKKSGLVFFEPSEKGVDGSSAAVSATNQDAATNPADIEPAAGTDAALEDSNDSSLADDMKLPRKN